MHRTVALWAALALFGVGVLYRISGWFRHGLAPEARAHTVRARLGAAARGISSAVFGRKIVALLDALACDVVLQRRILNESAARWVAHVCLSAAFVLLVAMHALGQTLTRRFFPSYVPTLDPFQFLRDLLATVLLAGLVVAAYRRYVLRTPRRTTAPSDSYALGLVALIVVSGVLLEAVEIGSYSKYREMVAEYADPAAPRDALEAYWVAEMGTVAPGVRPDAALVARGREVHAASCAACHSSARSAFLGYASAAALRPVAPALDRAHATAILSTVHFFACLLGLALLPFSKLFHLVSTPIALLVRAGAGPARSTGPNHATRQMLELDACTHCSTCSTHCSMSMAAEAIGNPAVLPSERMAALRTLASGGELAPAARRAVEEGIWMCTGCERCTVSCPAGIDVHGLWVSAREALAGRGEPAYALLSPLSFRRAFVEDGVDPAAFREAVERPRQAIAARFGAAGPSGGSAPLSPGAEAPWPAPRQVQAGSFLLCFGCKTCSTACPVVRAEPAPQQKLGLLPHQVMHAARLRLWDQVLGSNMLWSCLGCYQCQQHCPQGVAVTDVLYELKNAAITLTRAARDGARA